MAKFRFADLKSLSTAKKSIFIGFIVASLVFPLGRFLLPFLPLLFINPASPKPPPVIARPPLIGDDKRQPPTTSNDELVDQINDYRHQNSLPRLDFDPIVRQVAAQNAMENSILGRITNLVPPGNKTVDQELFSRGLTKPGPGYVSGVGAQNYGSAQRLFDAMKANPGANADMLSANITRIGTGYIWTPSAGSFWTILYY